MFQSTIRFRLVVAVAAVLLLCCTLNAEIPKYISYQGKVTDSGGTPVPNGNYTMRFRIYNAPSGGALRWDSGNRTVALNDGVFNVQLGENTVLNLNFEEDYWLLVTFQGTNQTPRQRLTSAGYSYIANGLAPGIEVSGVETNIAIIKAVNDATTLWSHGLWGESASTSGRGVYGNATSSSGFSSGVYGQSASNGGVGVYGLNTATAGGATGVYGITSSTDGHGVQGYVDAPTGITYGIWGRSESQDGRGVYGFAAATTGTNYGVFGETNSTQGFGVYGNATTNSGNTKGVYGESASSTGTGVHGLAYSGTGNTRGVYGETYSTDGRGVSGSAIASIGYTYGVYGHTNSNNGVGVYGKAEATSGGTEGVYGEAASPGGKGVYGLNYSASGETKGVYGEIYSPLGAGVYGLATVTNADAIGVHGVSMPGDYWGLGVRGDGQYKGVFGTCETTGNGAGSYYGVHGYGSLSGSSGTVYGVYGEATGGATHYGVYYSGGISGSAAMKNIVKTDDGPIELYGHLCTENWFEDFGSGLIRAGRADINLPRDFVQTVTISNDTPIKVFITPNASMGDWWVEKRIDAFTLFAPDAPEGASFDYRVVAKRPGHENLRLEEATAGYADRALYQDLNEVPAQFHDEWKKSAVSREGNR